MRVCYTDFIEAILSKIEGISTSAELSFNNAFSFTYLYCQTAMQSKYLLKDNNICENQIENPLSAERQSNTKNYQISIPILRKTEIYPVKTVIQFLRRIINLENIHLQKPVKSSVPTKP